MVVEGEEKDKILKEFKKGVVCGWENKPKMVCHCVTFNDRSTIDESANVAVKGLWEDNGCMDFPRRASDIDESRFVGDARGEIVKSLYESVGGEILKVIVELGKGGNAQSETMYGYKRLYLYDQDGEYKLLKEAIGKFGGRTKENTVAFVPVVDESKDIRYFMKSATEFNGVPILPPHLIAEAKNIGYNSFEFEKKFHKLLENDKRFERLLGVILPKKACEVLIYTDTISFTKEVGYHLDSMTPYKNTPKFEFGVWLNIRFVDATDVVYIYSD